eukprot:6284032-Amphidinium_carterae.1
MAPRRRQWHGESQMSIQGDVIIWALCELRSHHRSIRGQSLLVVEKRRLARDPGAAAAASGKRSRLF